MDLLWQLVSGWLAWDVDLLSFTCNVLLRCFRSLACFERLVPHTDSSLTLAFTQYLRVVARPHCWCVP